MKRFLYWPGHSWLALPARFYLAWIFIYACWHKIAFPGAFALDIATYEILPLWAINIMAITLPWIELVAGLMLVLGLRVQGAALAVCGMMLVFIAAIVIALANGLDMSCGCFASQAATGEDPISLKTILRDTIWLLLAAYVTLFDRDAIGIDRLTKRRRRLHHA